MTKSLMIAASLGTALLGAVPAHSADMIEGYRETRPAKRYVERTVYVAPYQACSVLRIDYRPPNVERTEYARVCYPPLDLTPFGIREYGTGYAPAGRRATWR